MANFVSKNRRALSRSVVTLIVIVVIAVAGVGIYLGTSSTGPSTTSSVPTTSTTSTTTTSAQNYTLRIAVGGTSSSIDPSKQLGTDNFEISLAYDPLLMVQNDGSVGPFLATGYTASSDGLHFTLTLRQGVLFHDGTAFNATAVQTDLARTLAINQHQAGFFKSVANVTVLGTYSVVFNLKSADPGFPYVLASVEELPMVSPSAIKAHQTNATEMAQGWLSTHEAGTGPYIITSYIPQTSFTATAFQKYWQGWSGKHFTNVVGSQVLASSTRNVLVTSHQVDITNSLAIPDAEAAAKVPGMKTQWVSLKAVTYLMLDNSNPFISQLPMRKAIANALNYTAVLAACCGTHSLPAKGPFPSVAPAFNPNLPTPTQNLTAARQYLAQTNYTAAGSPTLTIAVNQNLQWKIDSAQVIIANLAQIGINAKLVTLTDPALFGAITTPHANAMYIWFQPLEVDDPLSSLNFIFHGPLIINPPSNPPTDIHALLAQAASAPNTATYNSILQQIQSTSVQKQYIVFLADQYDNMVYWGSSVTQFIGMPGDFGFDTPNYYAMSPP